MIRFAAHADPNWREIAGGYLRAQGNNPVVARLLLQIPQGEYVTREIASRLVLASMANPELRNTHDLDNPYYTLGEPEVEADFGTYRVPVKVYVASRR